MAEYGEPWTVGHSDAGLVWIDLQETQTVEGRAGIMRLSCAAIADSQRLLQKRVGRMVLCVNACAGLSDQQLQAVIDGKALTGVTDHETCLQYDPQVEPILCHQCGKVMGNANKGHGIEATCGDCHPRGYEVFASTGKGCSVTNTQPQEPGHAV